MCTNIVIVFFAKHHRVSSARVENVYEISLSLIWKKLLLSLIRREFDDDVKASRSIKHFSFFQKNYKLFAVCTFLLLPLVIIVGWNELLHTHFAFECARKKARSLLGLSLVSFAWGHKNFFSHFSLCALFGICRPHIYRESESSALSASSGKCHGGKKCSVLNGAWNMCKHDDCYTQFESENPSWFHENDTLTHLDDVNWGEKARAENPDDAVKETIKLRKLPKDWVHEHVQRAARGRQIGKDAFS